MPKPQPQYNNPTPVAVALIPKDGGLIIIRRAIAPIGGWALPGGFIDEMETAEIACAREVKEETGFILEAGMFKPMTTRITPRNQLLIFLLYTGSTKEIDLNDFVPNKEASACLIGYPKDELCFPLHTELLQMRHLWERI